MFRNSSQILVPGVISRNAVDIARLASSEWWDISGATCVGAWQAIGAASYAASLVDLSGNGNDLTTEVSAPSWGATNGWSFSGSEGLNTGIIAADGYTIGGRYTSMYNPSQGTAQNSTLIGAGLSGGGDGFQIRPRWNIDDGIGACAHNGGAAVDSGYAVHPSDAVWIAAERSVYVDATLKKSNLGSTPLATQTSTICIGVLPYNANANHTYYFIGTIGACAVYSTTLDSTQVSQLTANMAAL